MKFLNILMVVYLLFFPTIFFAVSEFYYVRHGQTDFNIKKEKKYWDMPLNDTGRKQIESLKNIVQKLPVENIFFSPLVRTKETKNIIKKYLNVCEIPLAEIKEGEEGAYLEIIKLKNNKNYICSKKTTKFIKRIKKGIAKVLDCPKLSLVVGHGAVYAGICYSLDIKTDLWRIANGELVHFYKKPDGSWNVAVIADGSLNIKKSMYY
jgi:broad specificity phosphatase PhoE